MTDPQQPILQAARWIAAADSLIVAAGAGMGVDSGLPDFRGTEGFWRAYPALAHAELRFQDMACPEAFHADPELAWGFYGHRLALYRRTVPHAGFTALRRIAERLPKGAFVLTSNVDGQFQKAGFNPDRIYECHGSIHYLQCLKPCSPAFWYAAFDPVVDEEHCRMTSPLPHCPRCGGLARPNILLFGDMHWIDRRSAGQEMEWGRWRQRVRNPVVIELGAGMDVPTVRNFSEMQKAPLIRINPREPEIPRQVQGVGLAMGAQAGLEQLAAALTDIGFLPEA